jgi:hypothetical protein
VVATTRNSTKPLTIIVWWETRDLNLVYELQVIQKNSRPFILKASNEDINLWVSPGLIGLKAGETKIVTALKWEAYDDSKVRVVLKSDLQSFVKQGFKLEVGEVLPLESGNATIIN